MLVMIGKDKSKPNTYSEYTLADNRRRKPQNCAHKLRWKPHCFGDRGRKTSHLWRWPTWQTLSWRRDTHQPLHTSTFHTLLSKMNIKEWSFVHPIFRFCFLVTFGTEVMKIQKYYVIFVYILQVKMGKTEIIGMHLEFSPAFLVSQENKRKKE